MKQMQYNTSENIFSNENGIPIKCILLTKIFYQLSYRASLVDWFESRQAVGGKAVQSKLIRREANSTRSSLDQFIKLQMMLNFKMTIIILHM